MKRYYKTLGTTLINIPMLLTLLGIVYLLIFMDTGNFLEINTSFCAISRKYIRLDHRV